MQISSCNICKIYKEKRKNDFKRIFIRKIYINSIGEIRRGYEKERINKEVKINIAVVELKNEEEIIKNNKKEIEELKLKLEKLENENKLEYLNVQSFK